ncbi:MAG: hypothetical protein M3Y32_00415 [Pseudomonadota bacterium]|nr:hypothetical protein [Pseudomonadota bacterium]
MIPNSAPRHFSPATFAAIGEPGDRRAHIAARDAFASLKLTFLQAMESEPGVEWLRKQVRNAEEPFDLWLLRGPVFDLLTGAVAEQRARRQLLRRGLDSVFPDLDPASGFMPF